VAISEAIIAIQDGTREPRKVLRLVATRDGSFSISSPYHPARTGILAKVRIIPGTPSPTEANPEEEHRVTALVKLSYHPSGFVQFSSAERRRIRSGHGTASGLILPPKGLGLHSHPITDPILTGGTLGADFQDIRACKQLAENEKARVLLFREGDFFERDEHRPHGRHLFHVQFFVFPAIVRRGALFAAGRWVLRQPYSPEQPDWPAEFRIFDLPTPLAFLGILVEREHASDKHLASDSGTRPSGYALGGPRELAGLARLVGFFPASDEALGLPSLDMPSGQAL
jgi:hypothetical protein